MTNEGNQISSNFILPFRLRYILPEKHCFNRPRHNRHSGWSCPEMPYNKAAILSVFRHLPLSVQFKYKPTLTQHRPLFIFLNYMPRRFARQFPIPNLSFQHWVNLLVMLPAVLRRLPANCWIKYLVNGILCKSGSHHRNDILRRNDFGKSISEPCFKKNRVLKPA